MKTVQIDFVSDVACPWCAIGLGGLEQALDKLLGQVDARVTFQPFELNPGMPPEGENIAEHIQQKYGGGMERFEQSQQMLRERGAAVGVEFSPAKTHIWNTFDAHRLLAWAADEKAGNDAGKQWALKKELLTAYNARAENVSDPEVLIRAARKAGLDGERAKAILAGDDYALDVREAEQEWQRAGINAVPAVVVNRKYLISGGQPAAVYEQALLKIASETAEEADEQTSE